MGDAEVSGADFYAVYDPANLVVAEVLEAQAVEAVDGAVGAIGQAFAGRRYVTVGGDGGYDVMGIGVLYAHFEYLGASGLVDREVETQDCEELLMDDRNGFSVDGVDADANGGEFVGRLCVVADEGVFDVHGVMDWAVRLGAMVTGAGGLCQVCGWLAVGNGRD